MNSYKRLSIFWSAQRERVGYQEREREREREREIEREASTERYIAIERD